MTHLISTPLVGLINEPLLPFDSMPELKFDIQRTAIGRKKEETKKDDWLFELPCARKYGGGLLKNGALKKKRAFVSYPRSGNTWMRAAIMSLFGFFIDSMQVSSKVPKDCGCTILTKTHDHSVMRENYTRSLEVDEFDGNAILLIRNPFRSFISLRAIRPKKYDKALLNLDDSYIQEEGWGKFVVSATTHWERLSINWIRGIKRGGIFFYENLERNYEAEIKRLAYTMGLTLDPERLQCALSNRNVPVNGPPEQFAYPSDPYTERQKLEISQAIDRVQMALKERNFDPLPLESYEFYQPTEIAGCTV